MNVTHHATTARLPLSNVANHNQPQLASPLISPPTAADNDAPEVADALDNPTALKKAFGERCNWRELANALRALLEELSQTFPGHLTGDQQIRVAAELAVRLSTLSIPVCEDSDYYQQHQLTPSNLFVKLQAYLAGSGLNVPTTLDEVLALYQTATKHVQTHPLGNFSGALSWPSPMAGVDKQAILDLLNAPDSTLPGLPLADKRKGVLGYLLSAASLSNDDLKKPAEATQMLLGSAAAKALGEAIQTRLGGVATNTSLNDYLLAAIHLSLDPEAVHAPVRNGVAGFDLGQRQQWGKPAAAVIEGFSHHLVKEGRASAQSADLAARVLLARTAPECLVKDIPPSVKYGSIPWTQLAIAAAKLEAQAPGRVLTMTYSEVLAGAENIEIDANLTQYIQREAVINWGVVNGLWNAGQVPSDTEMQGLQRAFSTQQSAVQATATALATPLPNREDMGLALLREAFPGVDDSVFKAKDIVKVSKIPGRPGRFPGEHSMLDIVMQGDKTNADRNEHWETHNQRIPIQAFCEQSTSGKLSVAETFTQHYASAIEAMKKGHSGMAHYLISTLPPEDKQNFEYGELEFFQTNEYTLGTDFWTQTLSKRGHTLDVKITRDGQVNIYRIDTHAGTISKENYKIHTYSPPYDKLETRVANALHKTVRFNPFPTEHSLQAGEKDTLLQTPQVFDSPRTHYISRVFTQSLDLDNDDLLQHARGSTSYDKSAAADDAIGQFLLNLIPFRSAVVNFMKGNVGDGLFDLGTDVVGLVTLGLGKAAQAGKVLAKGLTSLKAATKTARFVGTVAIEALNPLSGASDLLRGAGWLIRRGARLGKEAVNVLKGASGSYDVLKAAGQQHGLAAVGTYTVAEHSLEGGAVFRNGHWYAYDIGKGQPYGAPLKKFQPAVVANAGQVKTLNKSALLGYEATVSPELLRVKGLQANVYVGPNNIEYVKVDGKLYRSTLKDGQRVIQHPDARQADIAVRDLGVAGWEPSASANRLFGGAPDNSPAWKLDENTYVMPIDDVRVNTYPGSFPYSINYDGMNYLATFDTRVGAWSPDAANGIYFWRTGKNKWQRGTLDEMNKAKKIDAHNFKFVDATPPAILQMPENIRPLPKDIHYFWAGGEISEKLVKNIAANTEKMPGFNAIVHVDADTPALFTAIKANLENNAPGITVMNLHEEAFFQPLKNSEMYAYFRQGQGKNLAAASDVARYPLMNKYGGIYLDTDDTIKGAVGSAGLHAGDSDILIGAPVAHTLTDYRLFFNTSNFATQADNPVVTEMIAEMNRRFSNNKAYFQANRPTTGRDANGAVSYTADFRTYESRIFETVGPNMFDDVLKARRPDIYDAGFDKKSKETNLVNGRLRLGKPFNLDTETRQYYADRGISAPSDLQSRVDEAKKHYGAFRDQLQVEVGAEHSWIDS